MPKIARTSESLSTPASPRVLIVAPSAYPLGGVATWLDNLVPALRRAGWRVELGLLAGAHHDPDRYLTEHPIGPAFKIQNPGGSREGRQRALAEAIRKVAPEVVVSVNVADVEAAVNRLRRSGHDGFRLATTQHGLQQDFYDHLAGRRQVVDAVICTNRTAVAVAVEYSGMAPDRVFYAPYGVGADAALEPAPASSRLRILWVGRLEEAQKHVSDLRPICTALELAGVDFELAIAGSGPEEARLRSDLAPWVNVGRVCFLGLLSPRGLIELGFSGRHVLLITSAWETGPIVAWEATMGGLAIATSRFLGSGREGALIDERTCLAFPVSDARAAAAALKRLRDDALRQQLGAAAMAMVRMRYSHAASVAAWMDALQAVARRPPLPAQPALDGPLVAGRLDRALGPSLGESVRVALGVRNRQGSAGDEWPHAYGSAAASRFLEQVSALDRRGEPASCEE